MRATRFVHDSSGFAAPRRSAGRGTPLLRATAAAATADADGGDDKSSSDSSSGARAPSESEEQARVEVATPFGISVREVLTLPPRMATVAEQRQAAAGIPQAEQRFESLRKEILEGKPRERLNAMQEATFYPRGLVMPIMLEVLESAQPPPQQQQRASDESAPPASSRAAAASSRPDELSAPPERRFDELSRSQAAFSVAVLVPNSAHEARGFDALLHALLQDPESGVRAAAAGALGHSGRRVSDADIAERIVSALLTTFTRSGEQWIVRLSAAASFGVLRAKRALPALLDEMDRYSTEEEGGKSLLVQAVIGAVGDIGPLHRDNGNDDNDDDDDEEEALAQRQVDACCRYVASEDTMVRLSVAETLGRLARRSDKAMRALAYLERDTNAYVAKQAGVAREYARRAPD